MPASDEISTLRAELAELRAELEAIRSERQSDHDSVAEPVTDLVPGSAITRRNWMKAAAAAALGGTAAALGTAETVAAANGDPLLIGNLGPSAQAATLPTQLNYTGSEDIGFLVQAGSSFRADSSTFDAALAGWTFRTPQPNGIYGFSDVSGGSGIIGRSGASAEYGVRALHASGLGTALRAEGGSVAGTGVLASGASAVEATGTKYGVTASGGDAALRLTPALTEPTKRSDAHLNGEVEAVTPLFVSGPGTPPTSFWVCTEGGSPGTWQKIAGTGTAGVLHPTVPFRSYDSRSPAPAPGRLSSGESRVVSMKDARDPATGAVVTVDALPPGATAVTYNLTIDATLDSGFLAVAPGDVASSPASSINWAGSGLILANAGVVKLDASRQVRVFAGGGGSTHFLFDITGYYL